MRSSQDAIRNSNEETSTAGNMLMYEPNLKRTRSNSNNCHQCYSNDKEIVVRCTKCNQKNYCIPCITKWYIGLQETDFAEACAGCRKICNCTACLHSDVANKDWLSPDLNIDIRMNIDIRDKIQYSKYIVRVLLPSLKKFIVEQNTEREEEARFREVLSWEPLVMWRASHKIKRANDFRILDSAVTNCVNWCEETINIHQFFKGYAEGLLDSEGRPRILKLEDWPPAESFQERLPRHFLEFVRCLPFKSYTHPHGGYLNMSVKTPKMSLKPDLGPKICLSYGIGDELGFDSATKLQYALSDRVYRLQEYSFPKQTLAMIIN